MGEGARGSRRYPIDTWSSRQAGKEHHLYVLAFLEEQIDWDRLGARWQQATLIDYLLETSRKTSVAVLPEPAVGSHRVLISYKSCSEIPR